MKQQENLICAFEDFPIDLSVLTQRCVEIVQGQPPVADSRSGGHELDRAYLEVCIV